MIIHLIAEWMKKTIKWVNITINHMSISAKIEVAVRSIWLCNKTWFKKATDFNTSGLAAKSDLAGLKAEVDKIVIDQQKNVPVNYIN